MYTQQNWLTVRVTSEVDTDIVTLGVNELLAADPIQRVDLCVY